MREAANEGGLSVPAESLVSGHTGRQERESNDRLTGLGGASLNRLGVDAEAHLGTGCQREPVQGVGLEVLHGVGARWVKGHMLLQGGAGSGTTEKNERNGTRQSSESSDCFSNAETWGGRSVA